MSQTFARESGRGLNMPSVVVENDEVHRLVRGRDLSSSLMPLCGRITIANGLSVNWVDGAVLNLSALSLKVTSYSVPDAQGSDATLFQTYGSVDLIRRVPQRAEENIHFGSALKKNGTLVCPFVIRLPPTSVLRDDTTSFTVIVQATYIRVGPATPTSPIQFEISSNPAIVSVTHRTH